MSTHGPPEKQGLYDPRFEHDACGVGFVCQMKGRRSHEIVQQALTILDELSHPDAEHVRNTLRITRAKVLARARRYVAARAPDQGAASVAATTA